MNCKHCNAELEEGVVLCPNCGMAQEESEIVVEDVPAVEEAPVVEETPVAEAPAVEEAPAKTGLGAGKIALLVVLAIAAIAVVIALILGGKEGKEPAETTAPVASTAPGETVPMTIPADGNPDDVTCKGSYSADAEQLAAEADKVVATMGDSTLTNAELQVYYWMGVYDFLNQYGSYASMFGLDFTKPMDMQVSIDGTLTWQQYFLDAALDTWTNYQAMSHEAQANSFQMDAEYADYLAALPDDLAANAQEMGYESVDEMIRRDMGPGATIEGYLDYLHTYYLGYLFYGERLEQIPVTDADVESYFDAHAEEYKANGLEKTDERYVDVRHILISPESAAGDGTYTEAEWAAAEKKANDVLNEWLTKNPDEDGFAVLAEAYSMDPGSASNGGLYEGVYVGQMVPEFENWCFDASRKTGDYGIVKTTYGYHIMYYVDSQLVWYQTAEQDLMVEKGNEFLQSILEKNPAQIDFSAIRIGSVDLSAAQ